MNTSTLLSLTRTKGQSFDRMTHEPLTQLTSPHGSAPMIWKDMKDRYLGGDSLWQLSTLSRMWELVYDSTIPRYHRSVLAMTTDYAMIMKKDYAIAAEDIRLYLLDFPVSPHQVDVWSSIRESLLQAPEAEAVGFHLNAFSENLFEGDWVETEQGYCGVEEAICEDVYKGMNHPLFKCKGMLMKRVSSSP